MIKEADRSFLHRGIPLFFGVLLVSLISGCATGDKRIAETHYNLGLSALNTGDYAAALRHLLEASKNEAQDPRIWNALGLAYFGRDLSDKAIEAYKKALELDPTYSEAWNNMGVVYLDLAQYDRAMEAFQKALENILYLHPERAWFNIGMVQFRRQNYNQAILAFRQATRFAPNMCDAHYYIGESYMAMEKYREAVETFRTIMRICPENPYVYRSAGIAYLKLKKPQTARIYLEKGLSLLREGPLYEELQRYLRLLPNQ